MITYDFDFKDCGCRTTTTFNTVEGTHDARTVTCEEHAPDAVPGEPVRP